MHIINKYNFIIPAPDHKEEKAFCDKHKKEYTKISYTLPSGTKYVSECERCEHIKYHKKLNEERKKDGYPTFETKQEMEAYFAQQKEDEIKQKNEKIEYQYKKGL